MAFLECMCNPVVMCLGKSVENREKFDWKPLYLDAQATTPMVSNLCFINFFGLEIMSVFLYSFANILSHFVFIRLMYV